MKKRLSFFAVLFLSVLSSAAQTTKTIQLTYNASDFTLETENGLSYISSDAHDLMFDGDTLIPALPHINIYVLIDNDKTYDDLSITTSEVLFANNVIIGPNEPIFSTNDIIPVSLRPITEYTQASYPQNQVEVTGEHIIDRCKVISFKFYPFRYDVKSQELFLISSTSLVISLQDDQGSKAYDNSLSKEPSEMVRRLVVNPDDFNSSKKKDYSRTAIMDQYECELLIITDSEQKPQYQRLANWKTKKGIRTTILTVEFIDSVYTASDLQQKIKNVISAWYFLGQNKLKYVLLGGTTSIVPTRICSPTLDGVRDTVPCDMYYGCMTSLEWDMNGNGFYGELNDHINLSPELIVSRLPTATYFDAYWQISRIIDYEQNGGPIGSPTWNSSILMSGAIAYNYYIQNGIQCSDVQIISGKMYDTYISPYWSGQRFRFFDTLNDYQDNNQHPLNSQNLASEINNGYVFLNMHCHGEPHMWEFGGGEAFSATNIQNIGNPQNTIIISNACKTNLFTASNCLGTAFMNGFYPNNLPSSAGVIAFLGSSGAMAITGKNLSPTDHYFGNVYKLLFTSSRHRLGEAIKGAKDLLLSECNSNNYYRYAQFSLNLLGDPEMPVYLSQPQENNLYSYYFRNDSLIVVSGVPYSTVCIMRSNAAGDIEYYQVSHDEAVSRFLLGEGSYTMTITAPDYKPVTINNISQQKVFIQNQTITTDTSYEADEIYIGKDVTTTQSQGPVSITAGTTTIKPRDYVQIKNSFTLELGAQLKILKSN